MDFVVVVVVSASVSTRKVRSASWRGGWVRCYWNGSLLREDVIINTLK